MGLKCRKSNICHLDLLSLAWLFLSLIVTPALHSLPSTVLATAPASVSFLALSPLLSPCSCLPLLLGLPSLPLLISSSAPPLKALESYCWEKNAKACGYQTDYIRGLWGSVSQNLISDLVWILCGLRSYFVKYGKLKPSSGRFLKYF